MRWSEITAFVLLLCAVLVSCEFTCGPYVAIDLTFLVNEDTIYYNGSFTMRPLERRVDPYMESNYFANPEHGGTHIDAPVHFFRYGPKVGQLPLQNLLLVDGVIIDVIQKAARNPDYKLRAQDIIDWERRHGPLPDRCLVMVNFGWAHKYTNRTAFLGIRGSDDFNRHFPAIGLDAAMYLVASGKVLGVGVDTSSVDARLDKAAHRCILGGNLYILEYLALDRTGGVPPRGFKVIVLPMRLENGSGAPANVVIMVDPKDYKGPVAPPGVYKGLPPPRDFTVNIVG